MQPTSTLVSIPVRDIPSVPAVSARWWLPARKAGEAVVILAHGAGSSMEHPLHQRVCAAISGAGFATLGFNFAYTEAGRRGPDRMPTLESVYRDVIDWVADQHPGRPLVVGGRSMGGRAASLLVGGGLRCAGLLLLNYPLLPGARRPDSAPRVDHWPEIRGPVLFVHGTRDRLFDEAVFAESRHLLDRAHVDVHRVDQADHCFAVPRRTGRSADDVDAEIAGAVGRWLEHLEPAA